MKKVLYTLLLLATPLFADSYQWLEEESDASRAWIQQMSETSQAYFETLPSREQIETRLRKITDFTAWGLPERHGNRLFLRKHKKGENKAVLVEMWKGRERVLVDPNTMEKNVTLIGMRLSPDGAYLAYGLSLSGSDQQVWHVIDLANYRELPRVFEDIQFSSFCWRADSKSVLYIRNYTDIVLHKLGKKEGRVIYQGHDEALPYKPRVVLKGKYLLIEERPAVAKHDRILLIDLLTYRAHELVSPGDFDIKCVGEKDGKILFISDEGSPFGKLIAIDPRTHASQTIVPEQERVLRDVKIIGNRIVCCYYHNACAELEIDGEPIQLPGKGSVFLHNTPGSNILYYVYTDFKTPPMLFEYEHESRLLFQPTVCWNPEAYTTKQLWYASKDGTGIPLFLSYKKDLEITDTTPVILYGYGGFGYSLTPFFSPYFLSWMEGGGVLAIPNLRGGKEFGNTWYEQGRLHNKQNVFDDFIAAAEWLISNKIGCRATLGAFGTSNGGLLTGACLTQRPDLFGAVVVNKGVLDMLRFHLFTIGRYWVCDYGDPENPIDYAYLLSYSPVHNVHPGIHYPPTLVNTADHDDRVVPMHSFKFAAALMDANASQHPILLRVEEFCGHGSDDSSEQQVAFGRDLLSFFHNELQKTHD